MSKITNLVGLKFGNLTVIARFPINEISSKSVKAKWICDCDCGEKAIARTDHLKSGNTISCGCVKKSRGQKRFTKHKKHGSRVYNSWRGMIERCRDSKNVGWKNYGGRGIKVCDRWKEFENFYTDMGEPPSEKHSIDRINVNDNYDVNNCRWATPEEQCSNKRFYLPSNTKFIEFNGESKSISQWARDKNIPRSTLACRLAYGWSVEKALNTL